MSEKGEIHKRLSSAEPGFSNNELLYDIHFEGENDGALPLTKHDIESSSQHSKLEPKKMPKSLRREDRPAFIALVILYILQGVPVGLAFGSIPFFLKSKLTYSQVGIFSLAAYPYSLKLLWSPFVDSFYSKSIGRRKSWIIPIQIISGTTLILLGREIDHCLLEPALYLKRITAYFFLLVFFCATQDIAVDGWALTCISPDCLSYASTAQTVGINCGYFSSFTVFLALNSPDFANKYVRTIPQDTGLVSVGGYLTFWGWVYLLVTAVVYFIPEIPPHLGKIHGAKGVTEKIDASVYNSKSKYAGKWHSLKNVYYSMYQVLKLPNVQTFVVILLIAKFAFQVNEGATNLKLLEKGLSKEDLSITVLIDFPFEMIFGYYVGRWSTGKAPLKPWVYGFAGRLCAAAFAQGIIYFFPKDGHVSTFYFLLIIIHHLMTSFMSTIQFVSICAFHTNIADPSIGGTYMTTLNTLSNYGGTWPKLLIFYLIDKLTVSQCQYLTTSSSTPQPFSITSEDLKKKCESSGGKPIILRDGFYYTNIFCIVCGIFILQWAKKKIAFLQSLPRSAWRVTKEN
ncbi:Piso0_005180 [Millerozyma farinosa CBS 7064]|uniref:Piso0_005180 protein n=1 Tax=Pichia sorbitophila (strain ATCC MYA-4447 / BCRC 22081 / CBS 7064 / NBRC 10061 / NRRL Y-12695) TaxID=559304 RepID=G8Y1H4_PICSO|nr:Piso0_005180 [Millerozyma farinosa CBS 7064]